MDLAEIILLVISFWPVVGVVLAAKMNCIKPLKPVETPNLRIENMMKDAETEHYPMTDGEFKRAKKAINRANQKPYIIAGCLVIWVIVNYYFCVWGFDEDMGKIYLIAACVAYGLFLLKRIKAAFIFKKDRRSFAKKKAYILDETMKNVSYLERKSRNRYQVADTAIFDVIVGVADAGGSPVAFKTRLYENNYHTTIDDKKQCDAILYKGQLVAVCNLNPQEGLDK